MQKHEECEVPGQKDVDVDGMSLNHLVNSCYELITELGDHLLEMADESKSVESEDQRFKQYVGEQVFPSMAAGDPGMETRLRELHL